MPEWMAKLIAHARPRVSFAGSKAGRNVQLGYVKGDVTVLNVYVDRCNKRDECPVARDIICCERGEK